MNKHLDKNKILIGKRLKETRYSLGLTQEYVAERLGLAPRYISDIEHDKTKGSIDTLVKLCNIYNITPTYVLQDFLHVSDDMQIDSTLIGFYQLNEKNKEIVCELISLLNKHQKSK